MENVVLGLLIIRSLTLYELNRAFKQGISLFYSASYGSLQAAVRSLLEKGWIVFEEGVEQGRNKKVYSVTDAGREAFQCWMLAAIPASRLEVTALAKVYFLGLMPDRRWKIQILDEIVAKVEQVHAELLQMEAAIGAYNVPTEHREILTYQLKTLDYGIQAHVFARAWFGALRDELE